MNAEGGTLLVGVADDGAIVGLERDYATLSKGSRDGFELLLSQLVGANVSGPSQTLIRVSFERVDGKDVCRLSVAASAKPVFAKPISGSGYSEFWVRLGNQTMQLHGTEMVDYQREHRG